MGDMSKDANQKEQAPARARNEMVTKNFYLLPEEDFKLREIVNRIRKEEGCRLTQVGWLRRKIEEEHAGLGK